MAVKVVVQLKAREDRQADLEAIMRSVATDLPTVPGCRSVDVLRHADDACHFILVETWNNQQVHKEHVDGLVADGTWASIAAILAEEPVTGYFQDL